MRSVLRSLYSPLAFDLLFSAAGIASLAALVVSGGAAVPAIAAAAQPVMKGAALAVLALACALLSRYTMRYDQKMADDFVFLVLAKSALMAIMGIIYAACLWQFALAGPLGAMSQYNLVAVILLVWSACYFIVRIQGTTP